MKPLGFNILRWAVLSVSATAGWVTLTLLADWYRWEVVVPRMGGHHNGGGWIDWAPIFTCLSIFLVACLMGMRGGEKISDGYLLGGLALFGAIGIGFEVAGEIQAGRHWLPDLAFLTLGVGFQILLTFAMARSQPARSRARLPSMWR